MHTSSFSLSSLTRAKRESTQIQTKKSSTVCALACPATRNVAAAGLVGLERF